ncbi:MAG: LysE family translocator [Sphingobacteriia bacterium]|nr:LysE family translocator [Sphingobacteriia bacterium]
MHPFLNGILIGLTLALLVGPALFVLLQTSVHRGFKAGLLIALGIFLSDLTVIILTYQGFSQILGEDPRQNFYFSLIGGLILIIFGTVTFTRKPEESVKRENDDEDIKVPGPMIYILKGYFLNIANPGVWFVWITAMVGVSSNYGVNSNGIIYFFAGAILTILSTDTLKCFVAHQLKGILTNHVIGLLNKAVGILLVAMGIFLVIDVFLDVKSLIGFLH